MLDTKMTLIGMEELIPGALWKGTKDQIEQALAMARKGAGKVKHSHDAQAQRWKLQIGDRKIEVQEVVSAAKTVDVERVLLAGDDADLRLAIRTVPPKAGTLDVIVHGTVDDFIVFSGGKELSLDHRRLTSRSRASSTSGSGCLRARRVCTRRGPLSTWRTSSA